MKTRFSRFSLFPRKKGSLVSDPKSEYEEIVSTILKKIPRTVLGKSAILEMKDEGSRNWRQMEWIGFWFEHFISKNLPSYEFDSELDNEFTRPKPLISLTEMYGHEKAMNEPLWCIEHAALELMRQIPPQ